MGKNIDECVENIFGVDVLCGKCSWAYAVKYAGRIKQLFGDYDRVIICAPYRGDGSLGVLGGVSDKAVFAIDQSSMRMPDVVEAALEVKCEGKTLGAVLERAGKSYVGGNLYVPRCEEEE